MSLFKGAFFSRENPDRLKMTGFYIVILVSHQFDNETHLRIVEIVAQQKYDLYLFE